MKDYHLICKEIEISAKKTPTAVFAVRGDVLIMPFQSIKFQVTLEQHPRSFVGVYDHRVTLNMIKDDIL